MQNECNKIKDAVPCAIGVFEADRLPVAREFSIDDARVQLAKNIEAFISYDASSSKEVQNRVSQIKASSVSTTKISEVSVAGSAVVGEMYGLFFDAAQNISYYRYATLIALNADLYKQGQKLLVEETATPAVTQPAPDTTQQQPDTNIRAGFKPAPTTLTPTQQIANALPKTPSGIFGKLKSKWESLKANALDMVVTVIKELLP
ncbi:hypothetical protein AGMMS49938_17730 [Fibrobacterales bacterium]|nr:hypothetical protein AGMMS49938_17730 [Fibrobacterales bacterium]